MSSYYKLFSVNVDHKIFAPGVTRGQLDSLSSNYKPCQTKSIVHNPEYYDDDYCYFKPATDDTFIGHEPLFEGVHLYMTDQVNNTWTIRIDIVKNALNCGGGVQKYCTFAFRVRNASKIQCDDGVWQMASGQTFITVTMNQVVDLVYFTSRANVVFTPASMDVDTRDMVHALGVKFNAAITLEQNAQQQLNQINSLTKDRLETLVKQHDLVKTCVLTPFETLFQKELAETKQGVVNKLRELRALTKELDSGLDKATKYVRFTDLFTKEEHCEWEAILNEYSNSGADILSALKAAGTVKQPVEMTCSSTITDPITFDSLYEMDSE